MDWTLKEAMEYYAKSGAPGDQSALVSLLKEVQQESGGAVPRSAIGEIAEFYGIKDSLLLALIKRLPSLRFSDVHTLELCAGPNCGKHRALADCAEKLQAASGKAFQLKYIPCQRMCGKGPNVKWDGKRYHKADEELLRSLLKDAGIQI